MSEKPFEKKKKIKPRVRFAPSPTGHLHVGNARTALFNWLTARQSGGAYVLRIEDTDVERSEARFETQLLDDMRWLGLGWDEGPDIGGPFAPYRQSDRMQLYQDYAERLLREGHAYYCFCTAEQLEEERKTAIASERTAIYSGKCRNVPLEEGQRRRAAGEQAAIRLKIPEHNIKFHDLVRGEVEFPREELSDPIIIRSTGMPVYNYVVVIDDIEMKITHVIRGDDHLSNTPKQVALYEALSAPVPEFAHLSTILGADRERLSKRHGATSIASFREMGVLPEALANYLALLGWAPHGGMKEIFTPQELFKEFSLERVTPSPAIFDFAKLYWLNRHYIGKAEPQRIIGLGLPYFAALIPQGAPPQVQEWFGKIVILLSRYVDKLEELPQKAQFILAFDAATAASNPDNAETLGAPQAREVIADFAQRISAEPAPISAERFKAISRSSAHLRRALQGHHQ